MVVALLLTGCANRQPKVFVHDVLLPMTPVKNQGKSELCWAYAMLATIETEHILRGDSVNLSAQYLGRKLERKNQRATPDLPLPKWVFMLGAKYTPQEFAHSVCAPDEYLSLTCWPDSPYYQKVDVPVPDNWEHNRLLNVPLDTLKAHVDRALHHRHPVCWESRGHAMEVVGMAHDEQQRHYYVTKNSWGSDDPHKGLVYMPVSKMWEDMIAIYMTKTAYEQ